MSDKGIDNMVKWLQRGLTEDEVNINFVFTNDLGKEEYLNKR